MRSWVLSDVEENSTVKFYVKSTMTSLKGWAGHTTLSAKVGGDAKSFKVVAVLPLAVWCKFGYYSI